MKLTLRKRLILGAASRLTKRTKRLVFARLAADFGISSLARDGDLGRFYGDLRDQVVFGAYLWERTWSPGLQHLLRDRLFAGGRGTLIDVGANIGLTSIPLAKARGVRCICFEPDPVNYRLLAINIAANGAEKLVQPANLAIGSGNGTVEFERSDDNWGDHRIRDRRAALPGSADLLNESARQTIKVECRALEPALNGIRLDSPIVLKIDVQGAEVRVLEGALPVLPRIAHMLAEYWPYGMRRLGDAPERFLEIAGTFPFAAIVDSESRALPDLRPTAQVIAEMRSKVPLDGTSLAYLDVLLSRSPVP